MVAAFFCACFTSTVVLVNALTSDHRQVSTVQYCTETTWHSQVYVSRLAVVCLLAFTTTVPVFPYPSTDTYMEGEK